MPNPDGTLTDAEVFGAPQAAAPPVPRPGELSDDQVFGTQDKPSVAGTALRAGVRGVGPGAAAFAAFEPGAAAGALPAEAAAPFIGPFAAGIPLLTGAASSLAAAYGANRLQDKALQEMPAVAKATGQDPATQHLDIATNPTAYKLGNAASNLVFMRPSLQGIAPMATGAAVNTGITAGQELGTGQKLDPTDLAIAAATGAFLKPNAVGEGVNTSVRPLTNAISSAGKPFVPPAEPPTPAAPPAETLALPAPAPDNRPRFGGVPDGPVSAKEADLAFQQKAQAAKDAAVATNIEKNVNIPGDAQMAGPNKLYGLAPEAEHPLAERSDTAPRVSDDLPPTVKDLAERIGEDPAKLVGDQLPHLNVDPDTFNLLSSDAQEKLVAAAQLQRRVTQPNDQPLVTSESEWTPNSGPKLRPDRPDVYQPTDTEMEAAGAKKPISIQAAGDSTRPFKTEDSSGLDFTNRDPENGKPLDPQAATAEQTVKQASENMRAQSEAELNQRWQESQQRQQYQQQEGAQQRQQQSDEYSSKDAPKTSNKAGLTDNDGRFPVDQWGHVKSDKGGAIKFGDQMQAAKWILNQGHKTSPDQIFEIANHPSGKGFTAKEIGRSAPGAEAPKAARQPGTRTDQPTPKSTQDPNQPLKEIDNVRTEPKAGNDSSGNKPDTARGATTTEHGATAAAESASGRKAGINDTAPRPADAPEGKSAGSEASGDKPLRDTDEVTPDNAHKAGGTKLYSGLPLDQIAKAVSSVARYTFGDVKSWAKNLDDYGEALKAGGAKSGSPLERAARATESGLRFMQGSHNFAIRAELKRTPSAAAEAVINKIHDYRFDKTDGRALEHGTAITTQTKLHTNKFADALGETFGNASLTKQIKALVTSGKPIDGKTTVGKAALALKAFGDDFHKYMTSAGVDMGKVKNYFPRMFDRSAIFKDPDGFEKALIKTHGGDRAEAAAYAKEKVNEILFGDSSGSMFTGGRTLGGSAHFKERVFGPEVDDPSHPLNKYYVQDPSQAYMGYIRAGVRRAEVARRFGDNFSNWPETEKQITDEGAGHILPSLRDYVRTATGVHGALPGSGTHTAEALLQTWMMFKNLHATARTILMEPLNTAAMTGNPVHGIAALVNTGRGMLHSLTDIPEGGKQAYIRNVGEATGLMASKRSLDASGSAAWTGTDPTSGVMKKAQSEFFKRTLITSIENERIHGGLGQLMPWLAMHAKNAVENPGDKFTSRTLQDLGVPAAKQAEFGKWLTDRQGQPTVDALNKGGDMADLYRRALIGASKGSLMMPNKTQLPKMMTATGSLGRLMGQLRNYSYSWWDQTAHRMMNTTKAALTEKGFTAGQRAELLKPLLAIPLLAGGQYLMRKNTNAVLNGPTKQSDDDQLKHAALLGAPPAPFEQTLEAADYMKYGHSPVGAFMGPSPNLVGDTGEMLGVGYRKLTNNPKPGDTHRAAQLFYSDVIAPALNMTLSVSPASVASGVATQAISSGRAANAFADDVAPKRQRGGGTKSIYAEKAEKNIYKEGK